MVPAHTVVEEVDLVQTRARRPMNRGGAADPASPHRDRRRRWQRRRHQRSRGDRLSGDCTESWALTQNVQLSATPASGSYFSGWSGACSGSGACNFTMATDRTVTATFGLLRALDVAVAGPGGGSVASTPGGIACPGDCTEDIITKNTKAA